MNGRQMVAVAAMAMPQPLKQWVGRRVLGWRIGPGVRIGCSYIDAENVSIGAGARIGHFNLFRNLCRLDIGDDVFVNNFNSFFGARPYAEHGWASAAEIGRGTQIMSHHFFDCAGRFVVGENALFAGRSTEVYTHERSLRTGTPALVPTEVVVGDGACICARTTLVSCVVPAGAVVGAGAVVAGDKSKDGADGPVLFAGNPAVVVKRYS